MLDLSRTVAEYIPEIGSGYAAATVQEVLNMDVVNEYSASKVPCTSRPIMRECQRWMVGRR